MAVDEIGVDETAVDETGVDKPGRYLVIKHFPIYGDSHIPVTYSSLIACQ